MNVRKWVKTEREIQELLFLEWIYDSTEDFSRIITFADHSSVGSVTRDDALEIASKLKAAGLVAIQAAFGGASTAALTTQGRERVREIRASRDDAGMRAVACRDAVLDWLYKEKHGGAASPNIDNFRRDPRSYFEGTPFTESEIDGATNTLKQRDLVSGQGSWGGGVMRPTITAAGEEVVEAWGGSIGAYLQSRSNAGTNMHQHNYPGAQGAMAGHNVYQTQLNSGLQVSEVLSLLTTVRSEIAALPPGDGESAIALVRVIEDEIKEGQPDRTMLSAAGKRLATVAAKAGTAGLVAAVTELVSKLIG
ncbi:hypothetical protein ACI2LF_06045 [Kribbella sp. NPDC020789]